MSKHWTTVFLISISAAYLSWCALYIHRTSFTFKNERVYCLWDDAMISMQYARNLRNGDGLVWNPGGERVQGYTNLGVTLTMAALHLLPLDANTVSLSVQVLNLLFLEIILLMVWLTARWMFPDALSIAIGSVLSLVLCAPLAIRTLQGTDVGFVTVWLCSSVALLARIHNKGNRWPRGWYFLLGWGLLIRPDTGLFYVLLLATAICLPGDRLKRLIIGSSVLVIVAGGWIAFSVLYYGDPLPNTYYLKATGSPKSVVLSIGAKQTLAWLPRLALPIVFACVAVAKTRAHRIAVLCAACFVFALGYSTWVGGDWGEYDAIRDRFLVHGSRFLTPCLPLLLLLAVAGCRYTVSWLMPRRLPATGTHMVYLSAAIAVALFSNPPVSFLEWFNPNSPTMYVKENQTNYRKANDLRKFTAPDTTIAVHWAGVPPYFSQRPAIDVLGKSDQHIAKMQAPVPSHFVPGHTKWDWDYILHEKKPDVFLSLGTKQRSVGRHVDFREEYFRVGKGNRFLFYVRKSVVNKLTDNSLVLQDQIGGAYRPVSEINEDSKSPLTRD